MFLIVFILNWYVEYLWQNIIFLEGLTAWIFFYTQNKILSYTFYSKITQVSIKISENINWFGELTFYFF